MFDLKKYKKMKEELFIDKWHDTCDILPETGENVWFLLDGAIEVGVYEEEQEVFCMADEMGIPLKYVRQWKYVGSDKHLASFPKEREVVAVELPELDCLALGHYTDHYVDEETGDEVSAVLLDGIYQFEGTDDMAIAWKDIFSYYTLPELPIKVICDECECEECEEEPSFEETLLDFDKEVLPLMGETPAEEEPVEEEHMDEIDEETFEDFETPEEEEEEVTSEIAKNTV